MGKRRTKPKKAFKPARLDNLCLDIKLPDLLRPLDDPSWFDRLYSQKPLALLDDPSWFDRLYRQQPLPLLDQPLRPVAFKTPSSTPGAQFQATNRIGRAPVMTSTLSSAADAARNMALSMDTLKRIADEMKDTMASRMNHLYGQHIYQPLQVLGPGRMHRDRELRPEDLDMVAALKDALGKFGEGADMRVAVSDRLGDHWPDFINAWLWGPLGEFTGFARVPALNEGALRAYRVAPRGGEKVSFELRVSRTPIRFEITVLREPGFNRFSQEGQTMFQFATYADYAIWEDFASHDRTPL